MLRFAAANIDGFDRWIAEQKALSSWLSTMHNRPSATATLPNS
jgi:hypothetical protein